MTITVNAVTIPAAAIAAEADAIVASIRHEMTG